MDTQNTLKLTKNVDKNLRTLREQLHHTSDFVTRTIKLGHQTGSLFFIDGIVNTEFIQEYILTPLLSYNEIFDFKTETFIEDLAYRHIRSSLVEIVEEIESCVQGLLKGKTLILFDGYENGILTDTTDWKQRSVEQANAVRSAAGPMNAFNEQLKVNINMTRNIVQSPNLVIENIQVGSYTKTDVALIFLKDKVDHTSTRQYRGPLIVHCFANGS